MKTVLKDSLPKDHCKQTSSQMMAKKALNIMHCENVLDIGCGNGNSADFFKNYSPGIKWVGVDIENSPEVLSRTRTDLEFHSFDGQHLPFDDSSFDLLYSNQVLEHVRHPDILMREMARILRPYGMLVGSTSHLEPYHSYSFWNITPYGFKVIAEDAGFEVTEIRPSIDSLTLILRRMLGRPRFFNRFWSNESPLNILINLNKTSHITNEILNAKKLSYCGQFSFICVKSSN